MWTKRLIELPVAVTLEGGAVALRARAHTVELSPSGRGIARP